jgi:hypothetical protein
MIVSSSGRDCRYKNCPGWKKVRKRVYRCEECTQEKGTDYWLCNTVKNIDGVETVLDFNAKYHVENKLFSVQHTGSASECIVISDLIRSLLGVHLVYYNSGKDLSSSIRCSTETVQYSLLFLFLSKNIGN